MKKVSGSRVTVRKEVAAEVDHGILTTAELKASIEGWCGYDMAYVEIIETRDGALVANVPCELEMPSDDIVKNAIVTFGVTFRRMSRVHEQEEDSDSESLASVADFLVDSDDEEVRGCTGTGILAGGDDADAEELQAKIAQEEELERRLDGIDTANIIAGGRGTRSCRAQTARNMKRVVKICNGTMSMFALPDDSVDLAVCIDKQYMGDVAELMELDASGVYDTPEPSPPATPSSALSYGTSEAMSDAWDDV